MIVPSQNVRVVIATKPVDFRKASKSVSRRLNNQSGGLIVDGEGHGSG